MEKRATSQLSGRELIALDLKEIKKYIEGITNPYYTESLGLRRVSPLYPFKEIRVVKFPIYHVSVVPLLPTPIYTATLITGDGQLSITYEAKKTKERLKLRVRRIRRFDGDMKLLEEL